MIQKTSIVDILATLRADVDTEPAWSALHHRIHNVVYSRFRRASQKFSLSVTDCEDLTQQVYVQVIKCLNQLQATEEKAFWAWVKAIQYSVLYTEIKKNRAQKNPDPKYRVEAIEIQKGQFTDPLDHYPDPQQGALENLLHQELLTKIEQCMDQLNPKARLALNLHLEGMMQKDICEVLKRELGTIKNMISKSKKMIQECLGDAYEGKES